MSELPWCNRETTRTSRWIVETNHTGPLSLDVECINEALYVASPMLTQSHEVCHLLCAVTLDHCQFMNRNLSRVNISQKCGIEARCVSEKLVRYQLQIMVTQMKSLHEFCSFVERASDDAVN